MNTPLLSRAECNIMRGLAIMGIFLHNYCHWLGPVVKENEYTFNQKNVDWLWAVTMNADQLLPMHWVSFFGHYGVPIFLFLSAYGLEMKYGSKLVAAEEGVWAFIKKHFLKLFSMMIVGFAAFIMVDAITPGRWHYDVTKVMAQLFMVNNLLPDPDHHLARSLLVLRTYAPTVYSIPPVYISQALGLHSCINGGMRRHTALSRPYGICHQQLSLQLHGWHVAIWFRSADGKLRDCQNKE